MLSCKDINQYTDKYIDGELSIKQRLLVRFHLLMCVHCRKYVRQLAAAINVFRAPPQKQYSDEQVKNIVDRLFDDQQKDQQKDRQ